MSDAPTQTPAGGAARRPQPNYAARRMLVTTMVITAIVALALVGWRVVKGGSDSSAGTPGTWETIALVDRTTGGVTTIDESGEVVTEIVGFGRATDVHAHGTRIALIGNEQIAIVDVDQPDAEPVVIPIDRGSTVTPVATTEHTHLVVGKPTGGNVLIVDLSDGSVIDVGASADQTSPLMFTETVEWNADGSSFAVADAANFQTIVVQPGIPGATFLPDQPVAVGDQLVATSQTVGLQADIALVDLQRRNRAIVPSEIPAGGVMTDDRLVTVSIGGGVFLVEDGDEMATPLGSVAVPAGDQVHWIRPTLDGERLVVAGDAFEAVISLDGGTLFTTSFTTPVDFPAPHPAWSCLAVGGEDSYHSVITLDAGEQLIDLTGLSVTGASSDGCTVIGERAGITEVATADGSVRLGQVRSATLGPDGRTVVWTTTTGRTELLTIDDELQLTDPIDLSQTAPSNLAVVFLNG